MSETKFSLPEVSSIDDVPEEFRPYYFEKDGQVHRQNPAAMVSTMAKVRRENEKLSQELLDRENRLKTFIEVLGEDADPDVIKSLKEKAARAEGLPSDEEVAKRIRIVEENARKERAALEKKLHDRDRTIEIEAVESQLRAALQAANANEAGVRLLPETMRKRLQKNYLDDGRMELIPLDEDGTRMYNDDGSAATLVDLANKLRADAAFAPLFEGTRASGLGTNGEAITLPKDSPNYWKLTDQQKIEFAKKHGQQKLMLLMANSGPPPKGGFGR